jgi:succinate dehydrogenase/fumarate reductase iron-sulfur protein
LKVQCEVFRHGSILEKETKYDEYTLESEPNNTVLGLLLQIYHQYDPTLAFRFSCGVIKCGECGVMVNGVQCLACEKLVEPEMRIDPLPNLPLIKDLVVDRKKVFDNIARILPFCSPDKMGQNAYDPEVDETFVSLTKCFECLICQSSCPLYSDPGDDFLGPLGILWLAQIESLNERSGMGHQKELEEIKEKMLGKCLRCGACSDLCPCSEDILSKAFDLLDKD